jgi:HEAT repeat protein
MRRAFVFGAVVVVGAWLGAGEAPQPVEPVHREDSHRVVEAVARLKLPDRKERLQALETIQRFPDKAVPFLIKAARSDDAVFRARVANALGLVGKGDRDALFALGILLRDPDTFVRREAIAALVKAADASAVPQLETLLADRQETVRADAVVAVADLLPPEKALERLSGLLSHGDARVRRTALAELLRRKDPEVVSLLPNLLKDQDAGVRGDAAAAVARLDGKKAAASLVELLADPDPYVRSTAVVALKDLRAAEATPRIIDLLNDKSDDVRAEAISALGSLRARAAIPALIAQLTATRKELRERAAMAMGLFREQARDAAPGLITLLSDADEGVRQKADLALRLILRANVGFQAGGSLEARQEAIAKWQEAWRKSKSK